MPGEMHNATRSVYNTWRAQMKQQMGGKFDWAKVTEADMTALSEKMFDAAKVPEAVRAEFWKQFNKFKSTLTRT